MTDDAVILGTSDLNTVSVWLQTGDMTAAALYGSNGFLTIYGA